ncbi:MAG: hypothetical protein C4345_12700, partial [Chloroflexota bacterium]
SCRQTEQTPAMLSEQDDRAVGLAGALGMMWELGMTSSPLGIGLTAQKRPLKRAAIDASRGTTSRLLSSQRGVVSPARCRSTARALIPLHQRSVFHRLE